MRWFRILRWIIIISGVALIGWIVYNRFVLQRSTSNDFYFFSMTIIAILRAALGVSKDAPVKPPADGRISTKGKVAIFFISAAVLITGTLIATGANSIEKQKQENISLCNGIKASDEAISGCTKLIEDNSVRTDNLPKIYNNRATVYLHRYLFELAIKDYSQAIALQPGYANALSRRCAAYIGKGEYDKGIADCRAIAQLSQFSFLAHLLSGLAYAMKHQHAPAFDELNQALRLQPNLAAAFDARCEAHNLFGETEDALSDCDQALSISPEDASILESRAFVYLKAGRYTEARTDIDSALKMDRKLPSALFARGLLERRDGDEASASKDFSAAKALKADVADDVAMYDLKL